MFIALAEEAAAHHVWLLGSQVSFPTLSMQNFWGPLLPEWVKHADRQVIMLCKNTNICVIINSKHN